MLSFVGKRSLAAIAGMSLALAGLIAIAPTLDQHVVQHVNDVSRNDLGSPREYR